MWSLLRASSFISWKLFGGTTFENRYWNRKDLVWYKCSLQGARDVGRRYCQAHRMISWRMRAAHSTRSMLLFYHEWCSQLIRAFKRRSAIHDSRGIVRSSKQARDYSLTAVFLLRPWENINLWLRSISDVLCFCCYAYSECISRAMNRYPSSGIRLRDYGDFTSPIIACHRLFDVSDNHVSYASCTWLETLNTSHKMSGYSVWSSELAHVVQHARSQLIELEIICAQPQFKPWYSRTSLLIGGHYQSRKK